MIRNLLTVAFLILASTTANAEQFTKDGKQIDVCGGLPGFECGRGEWCDFPDNAVCGAVDVLGTCKPRPGACIKVYMPVCGCNGETYGNACEAAAGGVDVAYLGECKARGK